MLGKHVALKDWVGGRLEKTKEKSSVKVDRMKPKGEIEGKYKPEGRVDCHKLKQQFRGEHELNNEGAGQRGHGNR